MKTYLKIFVSMILVVMVGLISMSFAQSRNNRPREGRGRFGEPAGFRPIGGKLHPGLLAQLNLTEQQKEEIRTLQENVRTAFESNFEKLKTFQEQLKAATENGTFNEEQTRQILVAQSQIMIEQEVVRLRTDAAIFNLLTTEQKAQLEQLKQARQAGGGGRREGFRPPPPQN